MAQARLPGKNGSDTIQHHRWNFIFFGQTKTAIQDLLTTHIPISLVSYISFAWVRQGKHCVKPFLITEACVSSVPRPCAPVSPSPATTPLLQHDGLSYRGPKWTCIFITSFIIVFIKPPVLKSILLSTRGSCATSLCGSPLWLCGAVISCGSADPECTLERAAEDGETGRLRKRLLSPEEGEEGEEEDEEPALHSCDSCRQVFESLSDLTEHKINQCQLTGKQRSAHRASPPLCHSALLPLSLCASTRENAMLRVLVHCTKGSATPHSQFLWWTSNSTDAQTFLCSAHHYTDVT